MPEEHTHHQWLVEVVAMIAIYFISYVVGNGYDRRFAGSRHIPPSAEAAINFPAWGSPDENSWQQWVVIHGLELLGSSSMDLLYLPLKIADRCLGSPLETLLDSDERLPRP